MRHHTLLRQVLRRSGEGSGECSGGVWGRFLRRGLAVGFTVRKGSEKNSQKLFFFRRCLKFIFGEYDVVGVQPKGFCPGHPGKIPKTPKVEVFLGFPRQGANFEVGNETFDPHPFAWKTPHPTGRSRKLRTHTKQKTSERAPKKSIFGFLRSLGLLEGLFRGERCETSRVLHTFDPLVSLYIWAHISGHLTFRVREQKVLTSQRRRHHNIIITAIQENV